MNSIKIKHYLIISILCLLAFVGCAEVTESTGKVLDSAGSITRSASDKAWISTTPAPTPGSTNPNAY